MVPKLLYSIVGGDRVALTTNFVCLHPWFSEDNRRSWQRHEKKALLFLVAWHTASNNWAPNDTWVSSYHVSTMIHGSPMRLLKSVTIIKKEQLVSFELLVCARDTLPRCITISEHVPSLWEVNALKISASGTDLVGTSFQCHLHGTDLQYPKFVGTDFQYVEFTSTDFQYIKFTGTDLQYHRVCWHLFTVPSSLLALIYSTIEFVGTDLQYHRVCWHWFTVPSNLLALIYSTWNCIDISCLKRHPAYSTTWCLGFRRCHAPNVFGTVDMEKVSWWN